MAGTARLAVVFKKAKAGAPNQTFTLNDLPDSFRRQFFDGFNIDGGSLRFNVTQTPSNWDGLLWPDDAEFVLYLNERSLDRAFADDEEFSAFLEAVRCALVKGHVIYPFENRPWKERNEKYRIVIRNCGPGCKGECGI